MPRSRMLQTVMTVSLLVALAVVALWPATAAGGEGGRVRGAAHSVGIDSFEPTLGVTANGDVYFSITPGGFAIGWTASVAKSTDGGKKWADVGPNVAGRTIPPETNDPYIYVDPGTGRVFTFHMSPILTCSISSFSDDGGESWTTNPVGCSPTVVWDHQTMVAAKPRVVSTDGYPNVMIQCVNAVYAAMCSRSTNGGLVWQPSVPIYFNDYVVTEGCGAQHGHLAAGPNGKVYLPTSVCGTNPTVFISRDDGGTWERSVISKMDTPFVDPSVSVDSKGNLYAAFIDEEGWLYFSVSRNDGKRWSKPVQVAKGSTTNMPVIVAGDPGKVVIAYPATDDLPKGYTTEGYSMRNGDPKVTGKVSWGANLSMSYNALDGRPRFKTVVATGSDPIGRGAMCVAAVRCNVLIDFIEAVIGPDGRPYASFVDGCTEACATDPTAPNDGGTGTGLMVTLSTGRPLCAKTCWRYEQARETTASFIAMLRAQMTPAEVRASLGHSVDALSPELKSLRRDANRARVEAVRGAR